MPLKIEKEMGMYRAICIPDDEYTYYYVAGPHGGAVFMRVDKKNIADIFTPVEGFSKEKYNFKDFNPRGSRVLKIQEPTSITLPSTEDWQAFRNN